jgi:oligoribonuclease (3'-5' exoribonuclease)
MKPIVLENWNGEEMTKEEVEDMIIETLERAIKKKDDACTVCGNTLIYASAYEKFVKIYVCEIKEYAEVETNGQ